MKNEGERRRRKPGGQPSGDATALSQAVFDAAGYAIVVTQADGAISAINHAAERLTGYAAEDILGRKNLTSLFDPAILLDHAMELSAALAQAIEPDFQVMALRTARGELFEREWPLLQKSGGRVPVQLSLSPIEHGSNSAYLAIMVDVSARKQESLRLQRSDLCMRATLENTPNVAVQWYDLSGRVLFWNAASENFYGWRANEMLGRTPEGLTHSVSQFGQFLESLRRVARDGGHVGPEEFALRRHDGSQLIIVSTLFAIPGEDVTPYFVRMDIDITDRYRAEGEVKQQRNMLQGAMEAMPGLFYLLDSDGHLLSWNRNLEIFTGLSSDKLLGSSFLELIYPEDRDLARNRARSVLRLGKMTSFEMRMVGRSGRLMPVLANGNRVIIDGRACLVGAAIDLSARKIAERELARSKQKLIERNESLRVINQLSSRLHGTLEVDGVIQATLEALRGYTRVNVFGIFVFDQTLRHLRLVASYGFDDAMTRDGSTLPMTGSLSGMALAQGNLVISADVSIDGRLEPRVRKMLQSRDIGSAVVIPLLHFGKPLGSINLLYQRRPDLGEVEMETFEAIGKTVSMALANAYHLDNLQYQAQHDALTGLPNRTVLHERFARMAEVADVRESPLAMMLLDLNHFKEINDTLGHPVGDVLLRSISQRLQELLQTRSAMLCRLGGDEFAVLVEKAGDSQAIGEAILEALRQPFAVETMHLSVGGSIGIAFYPRDGADSYELLRSADVAMYEAKRNGGGISVYQRTRDRHTPERLALIGEIDAAIAGGQLCLHYQPKLSADGAQVIGFEALVRWQHPRFGLLMPATFVPLIEVSEAIHPLTREVLRQALAEQRGWRQRGMSYSLAVNLSARNLLAGQFLPDLQKLLAEADSDPAALELEITETALMQDPEGAAQLLDQIAALGVRLSIDDFGTGHSSLAYLRRLPIQSLKIDQVFIRSMAGNAQDAIIVRSTISLAHNLGLQVVAEGVEDAAVAAMLQEMGCDLVQGYHFCRPKTWREIERWLADRGENGITTLSAGS